MWALEPFRMMTEPAHFWSEISFLFSLSMGIIYWDTYAPYPKTYLHFCEPSQYGKNLLHLMWILRTSDCNNHKQCNQIKEAYITLTKYAMTECIFIHIIDDLPNFDLFVSLYYVLNLSIVISLSDQAIFE